MEIFKKRTNFEFMKYRNMFGVISLLLIFASVGVIAYKGISLGIDFTGGTMVEFGFAKSADISVVREVLAKNGFADAQVQRFGAESEVLVRVPASHAGEGEQAKIGNKVHEVLQAGLSEEIELRRVEFVGPQLGKELAQQGLLALGLVMLGILIYVGFRFEWRFALGSIAALLHDPLLVLGFFAVFNVEFSITTLAALLAVMGYSLNDTVVVFDRIREELRVQRKGVVAEVIDLSINSVLARTLVTSLTTFLVVLILWLFGGPVIEGFAVTLIIGVVVGTYSSIFVASPVALWLGIKREHLLQSEFIGAQDRKDGAVI